jgi:surfeit locus 1 family protein
VSARRPRSTARLLTLGVLALLGTSLLLGLCVWQLQRREWKLALIERVDRRIHAAPVAAPGPAAWGHISAAGDEYLHVRVHGHYLHERETLVKAVTGEGSGYWVLTPLLTPDGHTVLVNRGFVPQERRNPATRMAGQVGGEVQLTGLLRLTEPKGAFLRTNQPGQERWYSRDVAAIASARHLTGAAPYFIDLDATPVPGGLPEPGLTVVSFPNNHLSYALTWLALAVILAGSTVRIGIEEWALQRAGRKEAGIRIAAAGNSALRSHL